jgi:hypothetical protein
MKPLASLVVLAGLALPCPASDPAGARMESGKPSPRSRAAGGFVARIVPMPPPKLLSDRVVRTVLLPHRDLGEWALIRAGVLPGRQFAGNVIGLQVPGVPTPDLDTPVRVTSFGRLLNLLPGR